MTPEPDPARIAQRQLSARDLAAWLGDESRSLDDFRDHDDDLDMRLARGARLSAYLYDHGINRRGWPVECGGSGGTPVDRAVVYDALTRAGLPLPESVAALEVVGCALVQFAPELAARHLPQVLAGEEIWCQGFSEPESGSDLASLRTTAGRDGDGWLLRGQKVWTSLGHRADWCAVLARTGESDSRHRGLTLFWVDMKSPGLTVRPLKTLTGEEEFAEVFLDDVRVPADHVIGDVDGGWAVAMYLLQYERGMWAWQRQSVLHAALETYVLGRDLRPEGIAELADVYALLSSLRVRVRETVARLSAGEKLGPEVSVDKILLSQAEQAVFDLCRGVRPSDFAVGAGSSASRLREQWFYSRASSIYGGAVEVQKNILATRLLGLPSEVRGG